MHTHTDNNVHICITMYNHTHIYVLYMHMLYIGPLYIGPYAYVLYGAYYEGGLYMPCYIAPSCTDPPREAPYIGPS